MRRKRARERERERERKKRERERDRERESSARCSCSIGLLQTEIDDSLPRKELQMALRGKRRSTDGPDCREYSKSNPTRFATESIEERGRCQQVVRDIHAKRRAADKEKREKRETTD